MSSGPHLNKSPSWTESEKLHGARENERAGREDEERGGNGWRFQKGCTLENDKTARVMNKEGGYN